MVSLSTCSPPALLWTSVCLLWCVCILFWGQLANGGNVKRLPPTSGGGSTIKWTWSAVGWVNLNQMRSSSHSPGIKTAFYLIFPATIRQFISIQTSDRVCLLRLHAGEALDVILKLMNGGRCDRRNILGVVEEYWMLLSSPSFCPGHCWDPFSVVT